MRKCNELVVWWAGVGAFSWRAMSDTHDDNHDYCSNKHDAAPTRYQDPHDVCRYAAALILCTCTGR